MRETTTVYVPGASWSTRKAPSSRLVVRATILLPERASIRAPLSGFCSEVLMVPVTEPVGDTRPAGSWAPALPATTSISSSEEMANVRMIEFS